MNSKYYRFFVFAFFAVKQPEAECNECEQLLCGQWKITVIVVFVVVVAVAAAVHLINVQNYYIYGTKRVLITIKILLIS